MMYFNSNLSIDEQYALHYELPEGEMKGVALALAERHETLCFLDSMQKIFGIEYEFDFDIMLDILPSYVRKDIERLNELNNSMVFYQDILYNQIEAKEDQRDGTFIYEMYYFINTIDDVITFLVHLVCNLEAKIDKEIIDEINTEASQAPQETPKVPNEPESIEHEGELTEKAVEREIEHTLAGLMRHSVICKHKNQYRLCPKQTATGLWSTLKAKITTGTITVPKTVEEIDAFILQNILSYDGTSLAGALGTFQSRRKKQTATNCYKQ